MMNGQRRLGLHVAVVRLDRMDHLRVFAVFLGKMSTPIWTWRALDLVVDGLCRCRAADRRARGKRRRLTPSSAAMIPARQATSMEWLQHVLPVAGAVLQAAEQLERAQDAGRERQVSNTAASSPSRFICDFHLAARTCLTVSSMRAGWMRPSAIEAFQRDAGDLAADRDRSRTA